MDNVTHISNNSVEKTSNLLRPRASFKPFEYPECFDFFTAQNQAHWMPTEVSMADDLVDFREKLKPQEVNLIIQVLRFFTQGDIEVNNNYNSRLIPKFPKPEVKMMLNSFSAIESIHVWAYSYLNDTLGLPEEEYNAFLEYESMKAKYEFMNTFNIETKKDLAKNLAIFGGFIEGVSLFASFAILLSFPKRGLLKNVGQIVSWSVRDESLHSEGVCYLFNQFIKENPELWTKEFREELYKACDQVIELESNFIDSCFSLGAVSGISPQEVKDYVKYIANTRLKTINLKPKYEVKENPFPWINTMTLGKEHANFFETRATDYSKGAIIDDF